MNASNYTTPFWVQDLSNSSWTLYLYSRNSGSTAGALDWTITVQYSTDGSTWTDLGTTKTSRNGNIYKAFSAGQKVYLRSKTQCTHWGKYDTTNSRYWHIQIYSNQHYSVGGNIMSLIYGPNFTGHEKVFPDDTIKGIFHGLFYSSGSSSNTNLIDAGELVLPVTHSTSTIPSSFSQDAPLNRCYASMFNRCTALVHGPFICIRSRDTYDLPYCLQTMFNFCTSLQSASTCLSGGAYRYDSCFGNGGGAQGGTFYNYSGYYLANITPRMTNIDVISMYLPTYDRVVDWTSSVSGRVMKVTDNTNTNIVIFEKQADPKYAVPFYVENLTSSSISINFKRVASALGIQISYSTDNNTWQSLGTTSTTLLTYSIPAKSRVYLKANTNSWYGNQLMGPNSTIAGTVLKLGGNIMSLLYGNNFTGKEYLFPTNNGYEFQAFFGYVDASNAYGVEASELILPATKMNESSYALMFGSGFLVSAPELPAMTLADWCYQGMFYGCQSLEKAPELPAKTLVGGCYNEMFNTCLSLNYVKCLAETGLTDPNLTGWLSYVSSTGTFVKKAGVTWPTSTSGIPSGWTVQEV